MAEAVSLQGAAFDPVSVRPVAQATPSVTTLVVENMHCGNCMRSVERALEAVPGVTSARVNLSSRRVDVVTQLPPATCEPFLVALAAVGFPASPLVEKTAGPANAAHHDFMRRLGVAGFAAANIMLLSVAVWSGHASDMPASLQTLFHWLSALIAVPAIAYAGQPFFKSARQALVARRLNMDVPISLGVLLATAMSLYQTARGSEQVYFDAAVTLLFFLLIGRALDQSVRARASSAAENLLGRRATAASVIATDGSLMRHAVAAIVPGMRILVAAGEQIPVDGRLLRASASIDESIITGESRPRAAETGDVVHAGTIAFTGPLEIEAIAVADNSLLTEIARLMQTAEQARGRYVRLADRAARLYAPAVHILGAGTFIGWMLVGTGWEPALTAAIAVLIITCPCALALAVPAVQVVAASRLFRAGIILKSPDALERFAEIDTVVLDKTGTLTRGRPDLKWPDTIDRDAIGLAARLAVGSRHPYAQAVIREARRRSIATDPIADMREVPGAGVEGMVDGIRIRLGSARFCGAVEMVEQTASLWLQLGNAAPMALPLGDTLRPDAEQVIRKLEAGGYVVEVLSGDTPRAVAETAAAVRISTWKAGQRPEQKIAHIAALEHQGRKVLMIGDGLNDAPALSAGHASLSPSSAADISQMAADAVFQGECLEPVIACLRTAKAARRRALENFAIAIGYNAVFVPLAMAGRVTPLIAAIAMSASSIAVTLNALRLNRGPKGARS